jgi:hypothetical protein
MASADGAGDVQIIDLEAVAKTAVGENGALGIGLEAVMHDGALRFAVAQVPHVLIYELAPRHRCHTHHDADLIEYQFLGPRDHLGRQMFVFQVTDKSG